MNSKLIFIIVIIACLIFFSSNHYDYYMLKNNTTLSKLFIILNPITFLRYNYYFHKKGELGDINMALRSKNTDALIGFLGDTTFTNIENFKIDINLLKIPHINVINLESIIKNNCNHFDKLAYTPVDRLFSLVKSLDTDIIKTCSENKINIFRKKTDNLINYYNVLNNHSNDYGLYNYYNTLNILDKHHVTYFNNIGKLITINNKRIYVISYTLILKSYNVNFPGYVTKEELIKIIDNLNINSDIYIVLSLHWPGEFQNNYDTSYYNDIINHLIGKVHLLYGHHGHIDGGSKTFVNDNNEELIVIYSCGNFYFEEMQYFARKIKQNNVLQMPYYIISFTENEYNKLCCRLYERFMLKNK